MTPVSIYNLVIDTQNNQYIVILEETEGPRMLLIWIGAAEAKTIALGVQNIKFERPLTHDLLLNILDFFDIEILRIVIEDIKENTYYAYIEMMQFGKRVKIDSRPSDAIALAVTKEIPIFVNEEVWNKGSVILKPITEKEEEEFKKKLENIKPEDFMDL